MSPLLCCDIALIDVTTLYSETRNSPSDFWSRVGAAARTSSAHEPLNGQVTKARGRRTD